MAKKVYKPKNKKSLVKEPVVAYKREKGMKIKFYKSFEEQADEERMEMARLSPIERLERMRQMIHFAWALNGFDWDNLPKKHKITFLTK